MNHSTPVQHTLLWNGIAGRSLEHCQVESSDAGTEVRSVVVGGESDRLFRAAYQISVDADWVTRSFGLDYFFDGRRLHTRFEREADGSWLQDGERSERFLDCTDVDIALTPFTNTLPIRRLGLRAGESREISVIHCDPQDGGIRPLRQRYTCLSTSEYRYENVPNDFSATIQLDPSGFVLHYPGLFESAAVQVSMESTFPRQDERMDALSFLIGTWRTQGTVLRNGQAGPAGFAGTDSYEWILEGKVMLHRARIMMGDVPIEVTELIGISGDGLAPLCFHSRDGDGVFTLMRGHVDGAGVLHITGEGMRAALRVHRAGSMHAHWERSDDGGRWHPWMTLELCHSTPGEV